MAAVAVAAASMARVHRNRSDGIETISKMERTECETRKARANKKCRRNKNVGNAAHCILFVCCVLCAVCCVLRAACARVQKTQNGKMK